MLLVLGVAAVVELPASAIIASDLAITSDDLFALEKDPGITLVIGGGYIAVECAGFLRGLGKDVYLANRSSFLRSMDNDMAAKITNELVDSGVKTMLKTTVSGIACGSQQL